MAKHAFSAVLLAGGKSSRMGRDKAGVIIEGKPLWKRQVATLRALQPDEVFISGRENGPYGGEGIGVLKDLHPECGPLGGLEAALHRMQTRYLVVLAIDLPAMRADFLGRLVETAMEKGKSVVPRNGEWFEPLAAVYLAGVREVVEECLRGEDHSMQGFIRRAMEFDLVLPYAISADERPLFRNVNEPGDLS